MRRAARTAVAAGLAAALSLRPATAEEPPSPSAPAGAALDAAFLPKEELRVPAFLAAHPQADGRGVVVAVLDTGVDPGHPRLARTSTGEPKIVDLLDATDDGLVDLPFLLTDAEVASRQAVGASGRTLSLGDHVRAGKRHRLGRVDGENALPPGLVARTARTRRERHEEATRRRREAPAPAARPGEPAPLAEARAAALAEARDAQPSGSPCFDVLLCERDGGWRAVLDTDADGDLAEERAIADYAVAREWVTLGDDANLNVAVRPDADGRRVRLLFDGNGHGTHVAGIVAGFEAPGHPLNGLAPGARILSIKIGNSRWGGVTTNFAIARALDLAGRHGAKVGNLSFGGPSFVGDAGTPDARVADEAVERYGLLCVFSAGNEGPALSTVGSPATARRVLSVGAHVSPEKMRASFSLVGEDPGERLFGFSSRGPLPGGGMGVSVLGPGGAWSTLPSWRLVSGDDWSGTSMAAPQVSGAAALLLSGALAEDLPADPARVTRALLSTARPVPGLLPVEQGAGLVQADAAYRALARMREAAPERRLLATVSNPTGVGSGIYERDAAGPAFDRTVEVRVDWPRAATNAERAAYERILVLSADRPWVRVPERLGLNANGGSFTVRVDPESLPDGVHCALVTAIDPRRAADGPELVVPVTVLRPSPVRDGVFRESLRLAPGERVSRGLRVPFGAGRLRARVTQREGHPSTLTASLGSLDQWRRPQDRFAQARAVTGGGRDGTVESAVAAGTVVELALFSHWGRNDSAVFDVEARFLGPASPDAQVVLGPGEDVALLRLATAGPFAGRVSARVDRVVERPPVCREVVPDPRDEPILGGDRLFVARQTFSLRLGENETVTVRPLGTAALDEVREDARWRVTDSAGRVVKKAVIDGPFDVGGLPAGEYGVDYETPTWRRAAAECGTTGFEVLRPRPAVAAAVYPTADLAAEGEGGADRVDLPAGAARSVALRFSGLDPGALYAGVVEVHDEGGGVALSLPLVVDRRTSAPEDPAALEETLVAAWRRRGEEAAADPDAKSETRSAAREGVRRARALRPEDATFAFVDAALEAASAVEPQDVERALARLSEAERAAGSDRAKVGRVQVLRARLERLQGKTDAARKSLEAARARLPATDAACLAERVALGLAEGGDKKDAVEAAKALAKARPADFAASSRLVDAYVTLGWGEAAAAEARTWPERFPTRLSEFRAAVTRIRAAGGDPAPTTLVALEAAAEGRR